GIRLVRGSFQYQNEPGSLFGLYLGDQRSSHSSLAGLQSRADLELSLVVHQRGVVCVFVVPPLRSGHRQNEAAFVMGFSRVACLSRSFCLRSRRKFCALGIASRQCGIPRGMFPVPPVPKRISVSNSPLAFRFDLHFHVLRLLGLRNLQSLRSAFLRSAHLGS